MVKYKSVACSTPTCGKFVRVRVQCNLEYVFCRDCKKDFSHAVLRVQATFSQLITSLLPSLMGTYHFRSPEMMAIFLGVHQEVLGEWIRRYVKVNSWAKFKEEYGCRSNKCVLFDCSKVGTFRRYGNVNKYYLVEKIRKIGICACLYVDLCKNKNNLTSGNKYYIIVKISDPSKIIDIQTMILESVFRNKKIEEKVNNHL